MDADCAALFLATPSGWRPAKLATIFRQVAPIRVSFLAKSEESSGLCLISHSGRAAATRCAASSERAPTSGRRSSPSACVRACQPATEVGQYLARGKLVVLSLECGERPTDMRVQFKLWHSGKHVLGARGFWRRSHFQGRSGRRWLSGERRGGASVAGPNSARACARLQAPGEKGNVLRRETSAWAGHYCYNRRCCARVRTPPT